MNVSPRRWTGRTLASTVKLAAPFIPGGAVWQNRRSLANPRSLAWAFRDLLRTRGR